MNLLVCCVCLDPHFTSWILIYDAFLSFERLFQVLQGCLCMDILWSCRNVYCHHYCSESFVKPNTQRSSLSPNFRFWSRFINTFCFLWIKIKTHLSKFCSQACRMREGVCVCARICGKYSDPRVTMLHATSFDDKPCPMKIWLNVYSHPMCQILYWECSVILFHLLVSQLGSEEQEQPAKNCPYRLQDNCSAPESSFLWTADLTESPLYFNEEIPYFKPGIYYSPIRSSS